MKRLMHKPLMLAYLIFLFISLISHIVCEVVGWSFSAWNNIIVAATAASYFFAFSSSDKALAKAYDSIAGRFLEYNKLLENARLALRRSAPKEEDLTFLEERIGKNTERIEKYNKQFLRNEKEAFVMDVLGYLVFFCTVSFDWLYILLSQVQDVLTLTAFIMILFVEYIQTAQTAKVNDLFDDIIKEQKELLSKKYEAV